MSVVGIIDAITDWAQKNICAQLKLKAPPTNIDPNDGDYEYNLVTPAAFSMYVPTEDKLPPNVQTPFPSLCVRILDGDDDLQSNKGNLSVQFCFSAWDTGTHGSDVFMPNGDGTYSLLDSAGYFVKNGDGWRDAWNFLDTALRVLESASAIGACTINRAVPVKYGPLTEQESIPDFYPFWFCWLSFGVTYPIERNIAGVQNLL